MSDSGKRRDWRPAFGIEAVTAERIAALKAAEGRVESLLSEAQRHAQALRAHLLTHDGSMRPSTALIVDDAAEMREMYAIALRIAGFHVEEASNGLDGFERALAISPHVIVMDFSMPVMDGGEAIRKLSRDGRTSHVPVMMISAYGEAVPADVRAMCAAFIAKPCEPEELTRQLRSVVEAQAIRSTPP